MELGTARVEENEMKERTKYGVRKLKVKGDGYNSIRRIRRYKDGWQNAKKNSKNAKK